MRSVFGLRKDQFQDLGCYFDDQNLGFEESFKVKYIGYNRKWELYLAFKECGSDIRF